MELMLRCELKDRPGALAVLARAIADAGGDIQAINIVESEDGRVLDDLVVVIEHERVAELLTRLEGLEDVTLLHAGPSRGHPQDAVSRLALSLEALLVGSSEYDRGIATLVGGLLRANSAEFVTHDDVPRRDGRVVALPVDDRVLVLRRDYRFTGTEREQAEAVLRLCLLALGAAAR